ncbi:MAG TPA: hypothetical protein VLJ68_07645 [Chitinophagaceae bacterium]|nr:hypothetical protein [Chitinophagaceae bacterium]
MKKIIAALALIVALSSVNAVQGQIRFNVNINLSSQPSWGPRGYNYVEYYYLPDIDAYYYVPRRQFVYLSGSRWIFSASLPPQYRSYDLYSGHKVVINQPNAYLYYNQHRAKYGHFRDDYNRSQYFRRDNDPRNRNNNNNRKYKPRRGY